MAEALCSETFLEFQMNKWLGKFQDGLNFDIVLIGDRKSIEGPLLTNILGVDHATKVFNLSLFQGRNGDRMRYGSPREFSWDFRVRGNDICVHLVPALSDAEDYKDEEYFKSAQTLVQCCRTLVIYCVDMSDTRLRSSVLRTLRKLETDWSRTVVVLTFTDALPDLVRHRENPDFPKAQYFNTKLAEWTAELKAMLERVGVRQEVVAEIKLHPSANKPEDLLPNGEPWLPPLSLAIMETVSPETADFLRKQPTLLRTVPAVAKQPATHTLPLLIETNQVRSGSESTLQPFSVSSLISECQARPIRAALSKLRNDCHEFGILVIGRTGVGKSTLINNLLGKEVASVGHTLRSETPTVYPYEEEVEGVPIVVYDTPGLGDVKGEVDEKLHLDIMKNFLARKKVQLVVYCFQMNDTTVTSSLIGAMRTYCKIGVDWERSVIALTFADAVYVPESEQKSHNLSHFFDERLKFWQTELRKEIVHEVGVKHDVVQRLKFFPTSLQPTDQLPNSNSWYVPLWLHIVEILSPAATVRFLDMHRNNISDEQAPPQSKQAKVEVNLSEEDRNKFFRNMAVILRTAQIDPFYFFHAVVELDSNVVGHVPSVKAVLNLLNPEPVKAVLNLLNPEPASRNGSEPLEDSQAVLRCLESFDDRFVKGIHSRDNPAFTAKLYRQKVIPEKLMNDIAAAADGEAANELLFDFLRKQATCESMSKLCTAMIEAEGHPVMNKLGREMKIKLGRSAPSALRQGL